MRTSVRIAEPKSPLRSLGDIQAHDQTSRAPLRHNSRCCRSRTALAASVDLATASFAMVLASGLAQLFADTLAPAVGVSERVALAALTVAIFSALGLYAYPSLGPCERFRLRFSGCSILAAAACAGLGPVHGWGFALAWGIITGGAAFFLGYVIHLLLPLIKFRAAAHAPVAIIGTGDTSRRVAKALMAHPEIGLRPIGFVAIGDAPTVGVELPLPLLQRLDGTVSMIPAADIAIVTGDRAGQALPPLPFAHVVTLADEKVIDTLRLRAWRSPTGHHADTTGPASDRPAPTERLLKRAIDLVLTVPFALLTLPITLAAIAAVRVLDPGRAIFIQQRIGKDGRPFGVYKIRTMYQDAGDRLDRCLAEDPALAEEWRTHFKLKQDPRILPVIGQILRKYSIDELPQLWNVLKGDMSLVGPRPFPAYHLESFDPDFQHLRQSVVPGLTGLWQISSRSDGDLENQKQQDTLYIENWSLWLDMKILIDTVPAVLLAKGAR